MAVDGVFARVHGLPDLKAALLSIAPKLRKRALRDALKAGARVVQRAARNATPVLKLSTISGQAAIRSGVRKPGTVRKAISVRTSKLAARRNDVGVFVNVRPAKKGARGAKNPNDPFYWRWLNYGWNPSNRKQSKIRRRIARMTTQGKRKPGARFLEAGAAALGQALQVFLREIGPRIQKLNKPKAPAP